VLSDESSALFRKVDCIRLPVPDLDAGLAFYRDKVGLALAWRSASGAGLGLPESDAELVIHTEGHPPEVDLLVDSAPEAAGRFVAAGGTLIAGPFETQVGMAVLVADPWGNHLVLLDLARGVVVTDALGLVVGNSPPGT
jgi:predicted enzyme related to lactoylglutathione lyase